MTDEFTSDLTIAIIGLACRFPGAVNAENFWQNLHDGVDSISHFTEEEARSFGVRPEIYRSQEYIPAAPMLLDADCFDSSFFGFSPKEAAWMDPQHRVFLECAWEALESSGYKPDQCPQPFGVFAGTSLSSYLLYNLLPHLPGPHAEDSLQAMIGNDKDFLSTRVSYKLNLRGPSLDVQTGCSTSLVAVHLACQSLLNYQSDMAMAGGVSIQTPQRRGYLFQPGGLCSPDGRCRAFDAKAAGTVFGSGVGIVILKRLADALRDRDQIIALIRGSAVNNDGSAKLGFTAPGVQGQAEVIQAAQSIADVDARSITYVECHGTATPLGDPVEIMALTNAFRATSNECGFCAIGSVKTNIGHLDAAAGIAGLIKTALALEHREIPPSLYYETPNPQIDFSSTPFFVNSDRRKWTSTAIPRRAGVSSFGIGGTNVHVIVEEGPEVIYEPSSRPKHILCLSARSQNALERMTSRLADYLSKTSKPNLADVAYTLQAARNAYDFRRATVCDEVAEAVGSLRGASQTWTVTNAGDARAHDIVFMFPGGGSQYLHMGAGLYQSEPIFKREFDTCAELLRKWLDYDLRSLLFSDESSDNAARLIRSTRLGLPALFSVEYALAQLWMSWGLRPSAMIGHSLGEYTAACISGVLDLADALGLVATRAILMDQLQDGAMLSVPLPAVELEPLLAGSLAFAAINGPANTVVSGERHAVQNLAAFLEQREVETRMLQIAVASHSPLVEPMLAEFQGFVSKLDVKPPQIPYISNLTGDWITPELISDNTYWVRHLRQTVLFHKGMQELTKDASRIFLEIGPGNALTTLAQAALPPEMHHLALSTMRHPFDQESDDTVLHRAAARLWVLGAVDDWLKMYEGESRRRIPVPSYPFEKQRHWIQPPAAHDHANDMNLGKDSPQSPSIYVTGWRSLQSLPRAQNASISRKWLVFANEHPACNNIIEDLRRLGNDVVAVREGSAFNQEANGSFRIRAENPVDYSRMLSSIFTEHSAPPISVAHMWSLTPDSPTHGEDALLRYMTQGPIISLSHLMRAASNILSKPDLDINIVSDRVFQINDQEEVLFEKSLLLGPMRVIPQENPGTRCRLIDIGDAVKSWSDTFGVDILPEILAEQLQPIVALRGTRRWAPEYVRTSFPKGISGSLLRENGVYMLLGGTGEIGTELAQALFEHKQARLVIASRHMLPGEPDWETFVTANPSDPTVPHLRTLLELRKRGADILTLRVDVSSEESMRSAIDMARDRFGTVHGIFHLAGMTGPDVIHLAADATPEQIFNIARAKVLGIHNIERLNDELDFDFVVLFSSTAAALGGVGLSSYAAASAVTEVAATQNKNRFVSTKWLSICWDAWLTSRYASINALPHALREYALEPEDALSTMFHLLEHGMDGAYAISPADLNVRSRESLEPPFSGIAQIAVPTPTTAETERQRLESYLPPDNIIERTIARAWQEHLGISRIGRDDKFFELGGNSLLALRIVSRLKKDLGFEIPVISVFEGVTVRGMAELLSTQNRHGSDDGHTTAAHRNDSESALTGTSPHL